MLNFTPCITEPFSRKFSCQFSFAILEQKQRICSLFVVKQATLFFCHQIFGTKKNRKNAKIIILVPRKVLVIS